VELLTAELGRELRSLRDVTYEEFQANAAKLPPVVAKRCKHVISENKRVQDAVQALEKGELDHFGKLMVESHNSLRDDYQVSCRELDRLVELTLALDGVLGARMTGAGFGGCTVAIMPSNKVADYRSLVLPRYESDTGKKTEMYVCQAVAGAGIVETAVRT
jgi:galactokinase